MWGCEAERRFDVGAPQRFDQVVIGSLVKQPAGARLVIGRAEKHDARFWRDFSKAADEAVRRCGSGDVDKNAVKLLLAAKPDGINVVVGACDLCGRTSVRQRGGTALCSDNQ